MEYNLNNDSISSLIIDSDMDDSITAADLVTTIVSGQEYLCDGRTILTKPWLGFVQADGWSELSCTEIATNVAAQLPQTKFYMSVRIQEIQSIQSSEPRARSVDLSMVCLFQQYDEQHSKDLYWETVFGSMPDATIEVCDYGPKNGLGITEADWEKDQDIVRDCYKDDAEAYEQKYFGERIVFEA